MAAAYSRCLFIIAALFRGERSSSRSNASTMSRSSLVNLAVIVIILRVLDQGLESAAGTRVPAWGRSSPLWFVAAIVQVTGVTGKGQARNRPGSGTKR